jgi:hypothetical protein
MGDIEYKFIIVAETEAEARIKVKKDLEEILKQLK